MNPSNSPARTSAVYLKHSQIHIVYYLFQVDKNGEKAQKSMSMWCYVPIPYTFSNSNFDAAEWTHKIDMIRAHLALFMCLYHRIKLNLIWVFVANLFSTRGPKKNKTFSDIVSSSGFLSNQTDPNKKINLWIWKYTYIWRLSLMIFD